MAVFVVSLFLRSDGERALNDVPQAAGEVPARPDAPGGPPFGPGHRWTGLIRHWLMFLGILGALVALHEWKSAWVNLHLSRATALLMAWIMNLVGLETTVRGVHVTCEICRFHIIGECTAFYPMSIYVAAVLSFPSPWSRRLLGVLLGIPALLAINQVRLISLCFIARSYPEYFETIHIVVWQSLIIFFTVLLWILWVSTLGRRRT
jgi:archaeosortase B (VPXXXP-CTERM-specific)